MQHAILSYGPPPLTVEAADAGLDMIDFIAAAVRGVDLIDVTDLVRRLWRTQLAYWYLSLLPVTREWYARAPMMLATLRAQWPLIDPMQRAAMVQQWSFELPQMLWLLDPVLAQAQAAEMSQTTAANLAAVREHASQARPAAEDPQAALAESLANRAWSTQSWINHTTNMTNATIGLMRAMNPQPRR
ncbi:MAG TPA: hypothetical protein VES67_13890 [Vicinamibacterales bacterium]|nr:hypothetical protein [Vicinamibacterales bacterium]